MAKNKNIFVTITGFQHYYGREPFQIGNLILLHKITKLYKIVI